MAQSACGVLHRRVVQQERFSPEPRAPHQPRDTTHLPPRDTARLPLRDTAHLPLRDAARLPPRDTALRCQVGCARSAGMKDYVPIACTTGVRVWPSSCREKGQRISRRCDRPTLIAHDAVAPVAGPEQDKKRSLRPPLTAVSSAAAGMNGAGGECSGRCATGR